MFTELYNFFKSWLGDLPVLSFEYADKLVFGFTVAAIAFCLFVAVYAIYACISFILSIGRR